jgi:hypothetical protein
MWRGRVHGNNLHHGGQSEIVRWIDYMVGRLNGLYLPGNPSDYRKKNSMMSKSPQGTGNSPSSNQLRRTEEAFIKTAKLKEILDRYFPPLEVREILSVISYHCLRKRNNGPLDDALNEFTIADEVRKAKDYLSKSSGSQTFT